MGSMHHNCILPTRSMAKIATMSDFQVLESLTPQLTVALENVTFLEEVSMLSVNFEGTDRILNKVTQRIIKI